jgi:hypothetical protein
MVPEQEVLAPREASQRVAAHRVVRWPRIAFALLVCALALLRFVHLNADVPDYSDWMSDQAKFTDEGWWAQGAVMYRLLGHWNVPGDYNPAAAAPVWPLLLSGVFHFTGVSVVAARAVTVICSIATLAFVFLLVRRHCGASGEWAAMLAVLLLVASPFAFVFARLAILETPMILEFSMLMLVPSCAQARRMWLLAVLAFGVTAMVLTKPTGALLAPAILWMAWRAMGGTLGGFARAVLAVAAIPVVLLEGYAGLVKALGYGADYKYFFDVNAMPDIAWKQSFATLAELSGNCFWVDRVLFPAGLAILVLSLAWKRELWRNPLFTASWIAIAADVAFIFSRQDDYAPRYFLPMLLPLIFVAALAFDLLAVRHKALAALLLAAIVVSFGMNIATTAAFIRRPTYRLWNAAVSIRTIVRADAAQKPLIFGVSGSQISLMTGIPSINDAYGTEDMAKKLASYQPAWYLAWNGIADENRDLFSPYAMQEAARYRVFDDDDRNELILYRMVRRAGQPAR